MPAALVTTKRKFHRLLDSISNASSPSLTTHHSTASTATLSTSKQDPPAAPKRARLDEGRPLSARVPRSAGASTSSVWSSPRPKSIAAAQTKATPSLDGEHKKPPNFAPWDRERFLERLKTFRFVDKWRAKPDERIGEVEWARRGWSCVGTERVACVGGCNEEIVIKLEEDSLGKEGGDEGDGAGTSEKAEEGRADDEVNEGDDWRAKAQEQLVERYAEMISNGHAEGCLWRRRGCDDTIQRLPLVHQHIAVDGLRARYQSLLAVAPELPPEVSTPKSLDVPKIIHQATSVLQGPSENTSTQGSPTEEINSSALLLALFGWQAEENHISGLATCNACFRRLGLWLFRSSDSSMDRLDALGEHRDYCPWVNPLSQNGGSRRSSLDGLAGWELLLRAVNARAVREPLSENANGVVSRGSLDDDVRDAASLLETVAGEDEKTRDERDRQRWAKLKRLKQVFHVKKRPGTSGSSASIAVAVDGGIT